MKRLIMNILHFFFNMKLKYKLSIAYMLIIVIPVIFIGNYSYSRSESFIMEELVKSHEKELLQVSQNIENKLLLIKQVGTFLYINKSLREVLAVEYEDENEPVRVHKDIILPTLDGLRQLPIYDIRIFTPNKSLQLATGNVFDIDKVSSIKTYQAALESKSAFVWQPVFSLSSHFSSVGSINVFTLTTILYDFTNQNRLLGVVDVYLEVAVVTKLLNDLKLPDGGWGIYIDAEGNEITRFGNGEISPAIVEKAFRDTNRFGTIMEKDNLVIFRKTALNEGKIITSYPKRNVFEQLDKIKKVTRIATIFSLLAVLTISFALSEFITRRWNKLMVKIRNIRDTGKMEVSTTITGNDEIAAIDSIFNKMIVKMNELQEKELRTEVGKKALEMELLQAQINPHFLYNTLSSIKWAINSSKKQDASDIIDSMVKFYRLSLNKGMDIIQVRDELNIIAEYINIQKLSYNSSFDVLWEIDERACDYYCIKLLLQPFVENAVLHGLNSKKQDGILRISVALQDKLLVFNIEDNGDGFDAKGLNEKAGSLRSGIITGGGFGINNVRDRIKLTYGDEYDVHIESGVSRGTRVEITIPAMSREELSLLHTNGARQP